MKPGLCCTGLSNGGMVCMVSAVLMYFYDLLPNHLENRVTPGQEESALMWDEKALIFLTKINNIYFKVMIIISFL